MKPPSRHPSASHEQQAAEPKMLALLSARCGVTLAPRTLDVGSATVRLDGYAETADGVLLVECFAHVGPLKGGQFHKVDSDVLKLSLAARALAGRGRVEARIVFADPVALASYERRRWRKLAAQAAGVALVVAELDEETCAGLRLAQRRQRMENAPVIDAARGEAPEGE